MDLKMYCSNSQRVVLCIYLYKSHIFVKKYITVENSRIVLLIMKYSLFNNILSF